MEEAEPDVLIVLDRSGSMEGDKWRAATRAVRDLTTRFEDRLRFGLMLFPTRGGCEVDPQPAEPCALGNAAAIDAALGGTGPDGESTPIGAGISRGRQYLQRISEQDRRSAIIVISDGEEKCDSRPVAQAEAAWDGAGIPVFVIAFGGVSPRALDPIARAGGTRAAIPADDEEQLLDALGQIAAEFNDEECNGIDDDCDGTVDEDFPEAGQACDGAAPGLCSPGVRICEAGALACGSIVEPVAELCNGLDDDCDGDPDEGDPEGGRPCRIPDMLGPCAFGLTTCDDAEVLCVPDAVPSDEICNLIDDDCDGRVDELPLPDVGRACQTGEPGICAAGTWACIGGEITCEPLGAPLDEVCDGVDNDCDGVVDDGVVAPFGEALCATGMTGRCAAGTRICSVGDWTCSPDGMAIAERCDGVDDDCDGRVDEGTRGACGLCGDAVPGERCDGLDDDCDDRVDEDAPCPGDAVCLRGACVDPCPPSRECGGERICRAEPGVSGEYCFDACALVDCAAGERCVDGVCSDPCDGVACGAAERCLGGACVAADCTLSGCAGGLVCIGGQCVAHPCDGVDCAADQACIDGRCVDSCATIACALDERCVEGACVADPCGGLSCAPHQLCRDGFCIDDLCAGRDCPAGQRCIDGFCGGDPCAAVRCPRGEQCVMHDGQPACAPGWVEPDPCAAADCPDGQRCEAVDGEATCVQVPMAPAPAPDEGVPVDQGIFEAGDAFIGAGAADAGGPIPLTEGGCFCDVGDPRSTPGWSTLILLALGLCRRRRVRGA